MNAVEREKLLKLVAENPDFVEACMNSARDFCDIMRKAFAELEKAAEPIGEMIEKLGLEEEANAKDNDNAGDR